MRVTNDIESRALTRYLLLHRKTTHTLQEQIASGKRVHVASDDPSSYSSISRLRDEKASLDRFTKNTEELLRDLNSLDGIAQQTLSILHRSSELIVSASDSTRSISERQVMGEEVNQLLEELVRIGNTHPNGRYIFSGLRADTPAFVADRDADGRITAVRYQGNSGERLIEIDDGVSISSTIPGSDLSGSQGLFQTEGADLFMGLIQLRDRLLNGELLTARDEVSVNASSDVLTVSNVYHTGSSISFSSEGLLPSGIDSGRIYYAIRVSDTQIQVADTLEDARAGVAVDITDTGSGKHAITQESLAENTQAFDQVINILSVIGARTNRAEQTQQWTRDLETRNERALEEEEAIDMAKAVVELSNKRLAYEAALRVASQTLDLSLMNFI